MKKAIMAFGVAGVLAYSMPTSMVKAAEYSDNNSAVTYNNEVMPLAEGLISHCSLSISASSGKILMNGYTKCTDTMKTVGFTDIIIQYSSDGEKWYKEKGINDLDTSNSKSYYLNDYPVTVKGGYYYRVTCNHYAKVSLFGSSQSVSNTSNSVWVNP